MSLHSWSFESPLIKQSPSNCFVLSLLNDAFNESAKNIIEFL